MTKATNTTTANRIKEDLIQKIKSRQARVCVVGLGYVGLPFAVEKAKVGFTVIGIDQNPRRAQQVNAGISYITDVPSSELEPLVQKGLIKAVTDFSLASTADVIVICVPTPLTRNQVPDLQYVISVTENIARHLRPGQLISLESTTYPGTTEEVLLPLLQRSGLKVEEDYFLCHSPERVDPGNKRYTTKNTNKVVGGVGPHSLEVAQAFYEQTIEHVVPVSSARAAEMVKVFENTFRAVNIALVNELAILCDKMGLNVWEVLDAAFTKPFGILPFYPGPGVGGHCIPIDPHYLEWKAREYGFTTRFIGLAGEINRRMPEFVREKVHRTLNEVGKAVSRSKILFIGMAYKKDLGDCRESPAIRVAELLLEDKAEVLYHDPHVDEIELNGRLYRSVPLEEETVKGVDLVVITTDHSSIDYRMLVQNAPVILDTRNATKGIAGREGKVVLL
ncbi:MAG: nucleotide sugar dehydrogenase [Firmicutes bacterium]|jgi:nucleotide sugar dehydrogenase|nr:nucleotide sugar dehydrogenase [Bacillota bacterium]